MNENTLSTNAGAGPSSPSFDAAGKRRPYMRTSAFTLLEILVVIAILGLLVGLVVSKMTGVLEKNEKELARLFVESSMTNSFFRYRIDTRSYPSTADGLQALITKPSGATGWAGPYIDQAVVPVDPWRHAYQYAYPGTKNPDKYDLWSMGPDGISGTSDDIGNWPESTQSESENK